MAKKSYKVAAQAENKSLALAPTAGVPALNLNDILGTKADAERLLSDEFELRSLPPIVKPSQMEEGQFFAAKIVGIMKSPIKEFKSRILQLQHEASGKAFCFPMTATVARALEEDDDDPSKAEAYIGRTIVVRYVGLKQGRDTSRKPARLFEVYVKKA